MSYTTMFEVPEKGPIQAVKEYRNAWGSAPVIWDNLKKKHLSQSKALMYGDMDQLWPLWKSNTLEEFEAACLFLTFDKVILLKKDFNKMADYLEEFTQRYPTPANHVNHLAKIAKDLRNCESFGVCFIWTSVADDIWTPERTEIDEDGDEVSAKYDISKDDEHYFHFSEEYLEARLIHDK